MATKAGLGIQLSYLYALNTQGGADAFIQTTVATPVTSGFCLVVREVLIEWPLFNPAAGVACEMGWSRKSFAAMPTLISTNQSLILRQKRFAGFATSGAFISDSVQAIFYDTERAPRIVEPNTYIQFDSNATGAANTLFVRLGYTLEEISDVDKNTILVATATAN